MKPLVRLVGMAMVLAVGLGSTRTNRRMGWHPIAPAAPSGFAQNDNGAYEADQARQRDEDAEQQERYQQEQEQQRLQQERDRNDYQREEEEQRHQEEMERLNSERERHN